MKTDQRYGDSFLLALSLSYLFIKQIFDNNWAKLQLNTTNGYHICMIMQTI